MSFMRLFTDVHIMVAVQIKCELFVLIASIARSLSTLCVQGVVNRFEELHAAVLVTNISIFLYFQKVCLKPKIHSM